MKDDTTHEWSVRTARSQRSATERRLAANRRAADREWTKGFVWGLLAGLVFAIAWFYPLVNP